MWKIGTRSRRRRRNALNIKLSRSKFLFPPFSRDHFHEVSVLRNRMRNKFPKLHADPVHRQESRQGKQFDVYSVKARKALLTRDSSILQENESRLPPFLRKIFFLNPMLRNGKLRRARYSRSKHKARRI